MTDTLIGKRLDEALEKLGDKNYPVRRTDPPGKNNSEGTLRVMAVRNGELIVSLFRDSLKEEKDDRSF